MTSAVNMASPSIPASQKAPRYSFSVLAISAIPTLEVVPRWGGNDARNLPADIRIYRLIKLLYIKFVILA
jgi:hypothetical protein